MIGRMRSWMGVGVMAGSSLDGADLARCRYEWVGNDHWRFDLLQAETYGFTADWSRRLRLLQNASGLDLIKAHAEFGHWLGRLIERFVGGSRDRIDCFTVHGPTIFHQPEVGVTFQLGDPEVVVSYCSGPVISALRNRDVALGGQGAPLVPAGERALFPDFEFFLNLGGIVNVTARDVAFDVCVGNQALDELAGRINSDLQYDPEGQWAARGRIDTGLLQRLESLAWWQLPPPKSLGREWYESQLRPLLGSEHAKVEDVLATLVEHIALRVCGALSPYQGAAVRLLVSGGGCRNVFLLSRIRHYLGTIGVDLVEPVDQKLTLFKEAIIFGFLGLQTLRGEINVDGRLTGASHSTSSGSIHLGRRDRTGMRGIESVVLRDSRTDQEQPKRERTNR